MGEVGRMMEVMLGLGGVGKSIGIKEMRRLVVGGVRGGVGSRRVWGGRGRGSGGR